MATAKGKTQGSKRRTDAASTASVFAIHYDLREHTVAENVATLLLLEQGLRQNNMVIDDLAALFNRPSSVVVISASVTGFAASLLRLLDADGVLPGRMQTLDVGYIRPGGHVRFSDDLDIRWRIVTMLCEPDGDDPADVADGEMRTRIANLARAGYPLLVIAENTPISSLLMLAADQVVTVGRLDADVIAETAAKVAGHDIPSVQAALATAHLDLFKLSVADLSVVIRPSVSVDRTIEMLQHILSEDDESQNNGGTAAAAQFGGRTGSQGDRDWDRKASSLSATNKERQGKSRSEKGKSDAAAATGAEIILPEIATQPYRLEVETLAGFGAARDWALDLKADLALWREGTLPWDQLSSRLLLSGPPGTGKTTFARALCNSLDLPLHVSSVSTWLEPGYLGSVITRMNAAFEEARPRSSSSTSATASANASPRIATSPTIGMRWSTSCWS